MPTPQNPASTIYVADDDRYDGRMPYPRVGRSGLKLPEISLGLWNNFGSDRPLETQRAILRRAFDLGITHFDLANNYGPRTGRPSATSALIFHDDFVPYRDELIISTKAGYDMWPGPYGEWGSRKYLLSLARPVAEAHGPRLRRHLLLAPPRPRDADRGDDGRARDAPCSPGKRAVRRHLELRPRADQGRLRRAAGRGQSRC